MSCHRPNYALQRARPSRSSFKRAPSRAGSLSLGRFLWLSAPIRANRGHSAALALESRRSFGGGAEHDLGSATVPVASIRRPAEWLGRGSKPREQRLDSLSLFSRSATVGQAPVAAASQREWRSSWSLASRASTVLRLV